MGGSDKQLKHLAVCSIYFYCFLLLYSQVDVDICLCIVLANDELIFADVRR